MPSSFPSISLHLLALEVPALSIQNLSTTATSIQVTVSVVSLLDGLVICGAFDPSVSISLTDLTLSATALYFKASRFNATVTYTISSLEALQTYSVYCYGQNVYGYGASLSAVVASSQRTTTGCCKQISFIQAPTFIDPRSTVTSSRIFSYALSALPFNDTSVVYSVAMNDSSVANASAITLYPSSAQFHDASSSLSSSFFFSAPSGVYVISLNVWGASAFEFSSVSTTVRVLSSNDPLPAPDFNSVIFADSGAYAIASFGAATDLAQISNTSWVCSALFTFRSSDITSCTWMNSSNVRMNFPALADSLLVPGDSVQLLPNMLKSACRSGLDCSVNEYAPAVVVNATASANTVSPSVVLSLPNTIGACADLLIDASSSTGTGGRPWSKVTWSVVAIGYDVAPILALLRSRGSDLSAPIVIPQALLNATTYQVVLSLRNFLQKSASASGSFTVSSDPTQPVVNIVGPALVSVRSVSPVSLVAKAVTSPCSDSPAVQYNWNVYLAGVLLPAIATSSLNPSIFKLPARALDVGSFYSVEVVASVLSGANATAAVTLFIAHGSVVAIIAGGSSRLFPVDQTLTLDGSGSYDEDSAASPLRYGWSCTINSAGAYGSDCSGVFGATAPTTAILSIGPGQLREDTSYLFGLVVVSADGRTGTASAVVTSVGPGAPTISIVSSSTMRINVNDKVNITSRVTAALPSVAAWTIITSAAPVDINDVAMTASNRTFSANDTLRGVAFPLATLPNVFSLGANYIFRVTCSLRDFPLLRTTAEVDVLINSPPSSGVLVASPLSGEALVTVFTLSAAGWTDDPVDYPLAYAFYYRRVVGGQLLLIAAKSDKAYASSPLPAGDSSSQSSIYATLGVFDAFGAQATAVQALTVTMSTDVNVTDILTSALSASSQSFDVDLTLRTSNNVASVYNSGACKGVPNCISLNRYNCSESIGSCGTCVAGFTGLLGTGNTQCHSSEQVAARRMRRLSDASSAGPDAQGCELDIDCPFFSCVGGNCTVPSKPCPSASPNNTCSGNGTCVYKSVAGAVLDACPLNNYYCRASCACVNGFGGSDCSLSPDALSLRATDRVTMCNALLGALLLQDPDFRVIDTQASALAQVFEPTEITSVDQLSVCLSLLTNITALAKRGYFNGASEETINTIGLLISRFASAAAAIVPSNSSANATADAAGGLNTVYYTNITTGNTTAVFGIAEVISSSVSGFTLGLLSSMVTGQQPLTVVSDNMRMAVHNLFPSDLQGTSLSPPPADGAYSEDVQSPGIALPSTGLDVCGIPTGSAAQLAVAAWGQNPYSGTNASAMASPLMRFSSSGGSADAQRSHHKTNFSIVLPFSSEQSNSTAGGNRTIPACSVHRGNAFLPCDCAISAVTSTNVTYTCFDSRVLCPPAPKTVRRVLRAGKGDGNGGTDDDYISYIERIAQESMEDSSAVNAQEYGTLLTSIGNEIASVLSTNPFDVNPADAVVVIALVSAIVLMLFGGSVYFGYVDAADRQKLLEAKMQGSKRKSVVVTDADGDIARRRLSLAFYGGGVSDTGAASTTVPAPQEELGDASVKSTRALFEKAAKARQKVSEDRSILKAGSWWRRFFQGIARTHTLTSFLTGKSLIRSK